MNLVITTEETETIVETTEKAGIEVEVEIEDHPMKTTETVVVDLTSIVGQIQKVACHLGNMETTTAVQVEKSLIEGT